MVMCVKYRKKLLEPQDRLERLKKVFKEIGERYWYGIDEIGTDGDHVHIFVGTAPRHSPSVIMQVIKSISAKQMFKSFPELRKMLWGGEFWSDGGYIGTVGDQASEEVVKKYIREQGDHMEKAQSHQLRLFKI